MVIAEAAANINSVTISTGIRLLAFFSISFRRALSRDCTLFSRYIPAD